MDSYVTGAMIKKLRENINLTQKQLADKLFVSDKTISKWETGKGLPDINILDDLASALKVSIIELFNNNQIKNSNKQANLLNEKFYVCPVCNNTFRSFGEATISCCGINLPYLTSEEIDDMHNIKVEEYNGELIVSIDHEMTKKHYISFICYVTTAKEQFFKLYPEGESSCIFEKSGHGYIYAHCSKDGLFKIKI